DAELADVCVHGAVGQRELHVATAAARSAFFPFGQFKTREVRYEIGLPLVASGLHCAKLALPLEIPRLADAILKSVPILEHEANVVEQIQDDRQIAHRGQPGRLGAGAVVVLVPGIDWNAKHATGSPLETMLPPIWRLDGCCASP